MSNTTVLSYIKRPVVVQAIKYDGTNEKEVMAFLGPDYVANSVATRDGAIFVQTLEGVVIASVGDFLIRGIKGEHYPCKPDIFQATYDLVQ